MFGRPDSAKALFLREIEPEFGNDGLCREAFDDDVEADAIGLSEEVAESRDPARVAGVLFGGAGVKSLKKTCNQFFFSVQSQGNLITHM